MKSIQLALISAFSIATMACGDSAPSASEVESIANKACECKDVECFEKYSKEFEKLGERVRSSYKSKKDMPDDLKEAGQKAERKMRTCGRALAKGGAGKTEPAGGGSVGGDAPPIATLRTQVVEGVVAACDCEDKTCYNKEAGKVQKASQAFLQHYGTSKDPAAQQFGSEMMKQLKQVDQCRKKLN